MHKQPILATGATGYVGGRLIPALLEAGYRVRAMGRTLDKLACRPWAHHERVELVQGDVLDLNSLEQAASGCRVAYYLVHSMIAQKDKFAEADRRAAQNMVAAASAAGLDRIIYLGGLAEAKTGNLSKHLKSRIEVAEILQSGPVPTTDLRTPMILGSGSASFEILRYLVERLPVMTTPKWVLSLNQPIAIRDVISYLIGCLEKEETTGQTFDIGGPDILTYRELLEIYAEEAHLPKRLIIPVPVLTPTLSALWIHLITPVPTSIALPLTEGLTSDAVCTEKRLDGQFLAAGDQLSHLSVVFLTVGQEQQLIAGMEIHQIPHAALCCKTFPPALQGKNAFDKIFADCGIVKATIVLDGNPGKMIHVRTCKHADTFFLRHAFFRIHLHADHSAGWGIAFKYKAEQALFFQLLDPLFRPAIHLIGSIRFGFKGDQARVFRVSNQAQGFARHAESGFHFRAHGHILHKLSQCIH